MANATLPPKKGKQKIVRFSEKSTIASSASGRRRPVQTSRKTRVGEVKNPCDHKYLYKPRRSLIWLVWHQDDDVPYRPLEDEWGAAIPRTHQ